MLSLKLVHLLEQHSDELADGITAKLHTSSRTRGLQAIPAIELRARIHETLCHFHAWLLTSADHTVEERYRSLGRHHAAKNVALPDVCWAIVLMKEHLWDFVGQQAFHTTPVEIHAELELMRLLDLFFDCAICHVTEGYEQVRCDGEAMNLASSEPEVHLLNGRLKWLRSGRRDATHR